MDVKILHGVDGARSSRGVTVVIDVLRACTTMSYLIAYGAKEIVLAGDQSTAEELKSQHPSWLSIGESEGQQIKGFDNGNSPSQLNRAHACARTALMLTSNGTTGVFAADKASTTLCASFVNAEATVEAILALCPQRVSLVAMGNRSSGRCPADDACAEYLRARLTRIPTDYAQLKTRIMCSSEAQKFLEPSTVNFPRKDLDLALSLDRHPSALYARIKDTGAYVSKDDKR